MRTFGTAGVRGVFNSGQTPDQIYRIALASAFVFGRGRYGVGWDGRKSSAVLARVAAAGIAAAGSEALSFGMVPTPVTAFGSRQNSCKLAFSVTASHNPPEYSGMKVYNSSGMELAKQEEERIERGMLVGPRMESEEYGALREEEVLSRYLEDLENRFERVENGLKIVVDCSNGPGALVTPRALQDLGHKAIPLNGQISWGFPARFPEPTPQTLSETAALVPALGGDVGFAHDGDADRLVLINASGRVLPDWVLQVVVLKTLKTTPKVVVISENTSSAVEEAALELGATVIRSRIGKTFAEIEKHTAGFATEPSKIVDPSWGLWEDGMYAAVLLSDALARDPLLMEELSSEPKWHYRQVNLPYTVDPGRLAERADVEFSRFRIAETRRLDGLKIVFKDRSWIMFRASGTEPKTRIYCESADPIELEELLGVGKKLLEDTHMIPRREGPERCLPR